MRIRTLRCVTSLCPTDLQPIAGGQFGRDLFGENGTTIGVDDDFTPDENQAFVVCGSLLSLRPLCFGAPVDKGTLNSLYDPGRHIFDGFLTRRGDNLFIFIAEG